MNDRNKQIINGLPYKIKKEKNVDVIYEYLLKQRKRFRILAIIGLVFWVNYIIFYFVFKDVNVTSLSKIDSVVSIMQIIIFPIVSFLLFKMSKKNVLTKEEIKVELER